jgi:hypothetical protein
MPEPWIDLTRPPLPTVPRLIAGPRTPPDDPIAICRSFNDSHAGRDELYADTRRRSEALRTARRDAGVATRTADACRVAWRTAAARTPHRRRGLPLMLTAVGVLLLVDAAACYLAAQVFDSGLLGTVVVTILLLGGLAAGEIGLDLAGRHQARRLQRRLAVVVTLFVVVLGVLRFWYLQTVSGDLLGAVLGAAMLSAVTGALVVLGCLALRRAETLDCFRLRRAYRVAGREADRVGETVETIRRGRDQLAATYVSECRGWVFQQAGDAPAVRRLEQAISRHLTDSSSAGDTPDTSDPLTVQR